MVIMLNNRREELPGKKMTVSELLDYKNMTFKLRIVKINGRLIPRDAYEEAGIKDGDDVQVFYLMSGG